LLTICLERIVVASLASGKPLPAAYHRLFPIRLPLGWPAFAKLIAVLLQSPREWDWHIDWYIICI
jgi:uncharacterized membrane protein